jgi:hypothetical protein
VITVTLAGVEAELLNQTDAFIDVRAVASDASSGHVVLTSSSGAVVTEENGWEYNAVGNITSVSPAVGQIDTVVTIEGTSLLGGGSELAWITIDGTAPASIRSQTESSTVLVLARPSAASTSKIMMVSNTGAFVEATGLFSYVTEGVISSVVPAVGQIGTEVTISGTSLQGAGLKVITVTLAGESATTVSESDSTVVAIATQSGNQTGDVVLTADTEATVTSAGAWEFATEGQVTSVNPSSGQYGTRVDIRGTGLRGAASEVVNVTLAGIRVEELVSQSDTLVQVIATTADAGSGVVVLTADSGAIVTGSPSWEYLETGDISSVSPTSGQLGTRVDIGGERLLAGGDELASVTLAGAAATIVNQSNSVVSVVAIDNLAGTGDVVLTSVTGAVVTEDNGFKYIELGNITSVSPSEGQTGTYVTISGTNLLGGGARYVSITLGGTAIRELVGGATRALGGDTSVIVRADGASAGTGNVRMVSDTGAVVTLSEGWTYDAASEIAELVPAAGQVGTRVLIKGSNLLGVSNGVNITKVTLAGVDATIVEFNQSGISVGVTSSFTVGSGKVVVLADTGAEATLADEFEYLEVGVVDEVLPAVGQLGTTVTISGSNLLGGGDEFDSVTLGGVLAVVQTFDNEKVVVVATASHALVGGAVVLVSDTGAIVQRDGQFDYAAQSNITSVEPASGQEGTTVTIRGTDLRGHANFVDSVTLVGEEATILNETDDFITAVAAASGAGSGDVVVTADTGAVAPLEGGFVYYTKGEVNDVSPSSGQYGSIVTISGVALRARGTEVVEVTLGGVLASIISEDNDQVVVQAASGPNFRELGAVVLTSDTGAKVVTGDEEWTYLRPSKIESVLPPSGRANSRITIFGFDLCGGGDEIVNATLAGVPATLTDVSKCGTIVITAADYGAAVIGNVVLTSDSGAITVEEDAWTYIAEGNVTGVQPSAGQGGTLITLTGERMLGGATGVSSVSLADVPAFVESATDTEIVIRAFDGPADGAVGDIVIVGLSGVTVRKINGWTYSGVTSVSPNHGQRGTLVTIKGIAMLASGTEIDELRLAEVVVKEVVSANDTEIVVVANFENVQSDQTGDVKIKMDNGQQVARTNAWTYKPTGTVVEVVPSSGQYGTAVTISGTNLLGYGSEFVEITIGGVAPVVHNSSDTEMELTINANSAGFGDIVFVSNSGAIVILVRGFEYVAVPAITTVSPGEGQFNTVVTIDGSDMFGGGNTISSVTLSGVEVQTITTNTEGQFIVVTERAGSNNICPVVCHDSCDGCSGGGADECSGCP